MPYTPLLHRRKFHVVISVAVSQEPVIPYGCRDLQKLKIQPYRGSEDLLITDILISVTEGKADEPDFPAILPPVPYGRSVYLLVYRYGIKRNERKMKDLISK